MGRRVNTQSVPEGTDWPLFTLQRWDWDTEAWQTKGEYTTSRGETNAQFAMTGERASSTGPIRLLKDGVEELADAPEAYGLTEESA
ncbi:hypothetical protein ACFVH9_08590 [Streptomyces hirsutus]|uniref:hypothetical protein n=1 Tax=Streptomyces hirsutus TaxID=35620 RepID=UPI00362DAFEE